MDKEIIKFCIENSKKEKINFNIFQNPKILYDKYGENYSFNKFKGDIFELLLSELFRGNGYLVDRIGEVGNDGGCDLIIKYPKNNSIRFILQAKNWNKAIGKYDIIKEFSKFNDNYKKQNNLKNNHFCFIAWNYVKGIKKELNSNLNINVWDINDIVSILFKNYKSNHPIKPNILLEPHQREAYNNILKFWNNNKRCYIEHATGTGKTYIIAKLLESLVLDIKNKILILSPSTYINDRIIELLKTIIPSNNIALRYKSLKSVNILTYQYLYHNSAIIPSNNFTHIIMDEAHRAGAPKWHEIGLLPIINNNTKIVGLSASMQRYSTGIDIKKFLENNCAGKLSLFRAITLGILPPIGKYVYSVKDIDPKINEIKSDVESKYNKYPKKKEQVLNNLDVKQIKDYSVQNILYKHYNSIKYQKIIAFCEGFEHSNEIRRILENTFVKFANVKIRNVTSKQSKKENKLILNNFSSKVSPKNHIDIIVAIDMLNEGIDVSGIDSIMLFRKTESPIVFLQQIGRVLRNHGKDNPLIFDCVLNYQNVKINLSDELRKEVKRYQKSLDDFGFKDIEIPKSILIKDEIREISEIIKEVELKLNFYRSYENAKKAVQKLGIKSESNYLINYRKDPRLPSKPYRTYRGRGWIDNYDFFGTERPNFYQTYKEAQNVIQELGIKSFIEYRRRYKEDPKLPSQPDRIYKNNGWIEWSYFFGTSDNSNYETYEEAKTGARLLNIKSCTDYRNSYTEDPRLPSKPNRTYSKEWKSFNDFLGIKKNFLYPTLEEAKQSVRKLGIKSDSEYRIRRHEDLRLPSTPSKYYHNKGWTNFPDFVNKAYSQKYLNYQDARNAVISLSIKTRKEYNRRYKEDIKLPSNPEDIYKGIGWVDYDDYLGIEKYNFYRTIREAKEAVIKLGIKSRKEYSDNKKYKEDPHLPSQPNVYYKDKGWTSWSDFIMKHYSTLMEAKNATRKLGIKRRVDYMKHKRYKENKLLPSNPEKTYANKGWSTWFDFLGSNEQKKYETLHQAKMAVKKLGIKSMTEYKNRRHEDQRLPSSPSECYRNRGWVSSFDFFGLKKPTYYKTYEEALKAVRKLGIKNRTQYHDKKRYKEDPKLHSTPDKFYKSKGWKDWYIFLGYNPISIYPTYSEAKSAVQKLNIKSAEAYKKQKLYKQDPRLPSSPEMKYKNIGWIDFDDFLGNKIPQKYFSYSLAKQATSRLKIKSQREYQKLQRYKEDPKLTSKPDRTYKNRGWISWEEFLE